MTAAESGLSVPKRITALPRELSEDEWRNFEAAADCLIPESPESPKASAAPDYRLWAVRALAARGEDFSTVVECLAALDNEASETMWRRLERMNADLPDEFMVLSSVIAGAYLMVPEIRQQIGYPGQGNAAPELTEAADQLEGGILDPVLARGPIFVPAVGE